MAGNMGFDLGSTLGFALGRENFAIFRLIVALSAGIPIRRFEPSMTRTYIFEMAGLSVTDKSFSL